MHESYVYIMTNVTNNVLYTGVTSNLHQRIQQHKDGSGGIFTSKYHIDKLVYIEVFDDIYDAITREKQIKAGSRLDKIKLIESFNPEWHDIAYDL